MTIRCCYGCTERTVTCHSTCGKYKAESNALKERNAMIRKQKESDKNARSYFCDTKSKNLKRYYKEKQ
jgi:hypothetical protein